MLRVKDLTNWDRWMYKHVLGIILRIQLKFFALYNVFHLRNCFSTNVFLYMISVYIYFDWQPLKYKINYSMLIVCINVYGNLI